MTLELSLIVGATVDHCSSIPGTWYVTIYRTWISQGGRAGSSFDSPTSHPVPDLCSATPTSRLDGLTHFYLKPFPASVFNQLKLHSHQHNGDPLPHPLFSITPTISIPIHNQPRTPDLPINLPPYFAHESEILIEECCTISHFIYHILTPPPHRLPPSAVNPNPTVSNPAWKTVSTLSANSYCEPKNMPYFPDHPQPPTLILQCLIYTLPTLSHALAEYLRSPR